MRISLLRTVIPTALVALTLGATACGGDDETSGGPGNGTDRAFVDDMVPHHESAVDMAEIAMQRGESDFVKSLADDIIETQNAEIRVMKDATADLADTRAEDLGVPEHEMGMDSDLAGLRKAEPFDRAFIDMMIPHHQGAIRMARVELAKGESETLKELAQDIIDSQSKEIEAMNAHRETEFGAASPAGGVPKEGAATEDSGEEHGGGHG